MVANALLATSVLMIAIVLYLMQALQFLAPYRSLIFAKYGTVVFTFAAALFLNIFALVYTLLRKFLLKDTGRKLAHLEKQLRTGETISEELSRRLREDE